MGLPAKQIALLAPLLPAVACSCMTVHAPAESPLKAPQMSRDSVALDIFFVRFPYGQEDANERLWEEVDEQHFPPELRRHLAKSGFRAGLITGQIPTTLSRLLELKDKPPPNETGVQQMDLAELEGPPKVVRRHLQCRAGRRTEILASSVYEELPVLTAEADGLCGQTYPKAQGVLALKAFPQPDGRVRIDVVPELHYGEPRQRFVGEQGALRLETGRARRVFDHLTLAATLAPGHMLLLASLPDRPGSLGHHFLTAVEGAQREQKLLVIRLAQTQHDALFDPDSVLPLEMEADEGDGKEAVPNSAPVRQRL